MRSIPSKYQRKAERASWAAGYRAGYSQRTEQTQARHLDLQPIYADGYNEGRADRENRDVEREARKQAGNALTA